MNTCPSLVDAIGNTPLIRLNKISEATGCEVYGKAEFMNPGGSVKDRAGKSMILDAQKKKLLGKGGIIVEGTAGNTGIGLCLVGNALGYKTIITMTRTQSQEKKDFLRALGAEVIEVAPGPFSNPNHYVHIAERLAGELSKTHDGGVLYANQWDNLANRQAHIDTTAQEIWAQTDGKVDGFICAIGTGGTISGTGIGLKEHNKNIKLGLADPMGSKMYSHFKNGTLESSGDSISEGIAQGRVTGNVKDAPVDMPFQVSDEESFPMLYDLVEQEGILLGGSSAINIGGAYKMAREMGPGHTIVTVLCDSGSRYQSKVYNPEFLRSKNMQVPAFLTAKARDVSHLMQD